jgi:NADH dehydrogenase (ubiquinone) 1 alpha subcomplex subunit 10
MMYMPAPTMDDIYIAPYGYDLRQLDSQLPEDVRSFDVTNFLKNPNAKLVAQFQIRMLMLRYSRYVDALAHLLSTGQGVVCNRCPFSDYVFLETMHKNGYISSTVRSIYYDLRNHTITEILKPHLVVYLDVPVKKTIENIKKRGVSNETQSKVLNEKYLHDLEQVYKQRYLKDITQHAELLVYDWSDGGDAEVVVEDIERIDFERFDHYDPKMQDWRIMYEEDWCERRMQYTSYKSEIMNFFNVPRFDAPELMTDPDDYEKWYNLWFEAPGMKYAYGYNAECGDTGILTKDKKTGAHISD